MFVKFMVNESGVVVERFIESYFEANKFIQKLKRSKKLSLIAYWKPF